MSSKKQKIEGYWWAIGSPDYPKPIPSISPFYQKELILKKLISLETKLTKFRTKGYSRCRCCKCPNGSGEYRYKNWLWPEGFIHYIVEHNIEPSSEFKKEVLNIEC